MCNRYALSYAGAPESAAAQANGMHYVYLVMTGLVFMGIFISLAPQKDESQSCHRGFAGNITTSVKFQL